MTYQYRVSPQRTAIQKPGCQQQEAHRRKAGAVLPKLRRGWRFGPSKRARLGLQSREQAQPAKAWWQGHVHAIDEARRPFGNPRRVTTVAAAAVCQLHQCCLRVLPRSGASHAQIRIWRFTRVGARHLG